jgi:hypothetical protein
MSLPAVSIVRVWNAHPNCGRHVLRTVHILGTSDERFYFLAISVSQRLVWELNENIQVCWKSG